MLLTDSIAKQIVVDTMNIIPYNINLFDNAGRIIASGDSKRLDQLHQGALLVLDQKNTVEIMDDSFIGALKGINMPILMNDEVVGVVGITGEVEEVKPFAAMVKSHIELLLHQQILTQELERQKRAQDYFFIDLLANKLTDQDALTRSKYLSMNLDQTLFLIVFNYLNTAHYERVQQYFAVREETIVVAQTELNEGILLLSKIPSAFITIARELNTHFASSTEPIHLPEYREHYRLTKRLLELSSDDQPFFSTPVNLDVNTLLAHSEIIFKTLFIKYTIRSLKDYPALIETLTHYVKHDFNISKTAVDLNVQRATIVAHLDKIARITQLDPKKATDCFKLYSAINLLND